MCSDTGFLHVWDKASGSPLSLLKADTSVVNSVAAHNTLPIIFTAGINRTIKMWEPRDFEYGARVCDLNFRDPLVRDLYPSDRTHRPSSLARNPAGATAGDMADSDSDSGESEDDMFWRIIEGEQADMEGNDEGDEIEFEYSDEAERVHDSNDDDSNDDGDGDVD